MESKTDWKLDDVVMPADMNRIEAGISEVNNSLTRFDCGNFDDLDGAVAIHVSNAQAHSNISVDGNMIEVAIDTTLEAHVVDPMAHSNLILDGNIGG